MRSETKGSVLVFTLWVVFILALLATSLGAQVRQKILVFQKIEQRSQLRLAIQSAVKKIMAELHAQSQQGHINSTKEWYDKGLAQGVLKVGDVDVYFELKEEDGKLNLNTASVEMLTRFFEDKANLSQANAFMLANRVIDFRDEDDFVSGVFDEGGSEKSAYAGAGLGYAPKNSVFEYQAEALLVKDMSLKIFESVEKNVTIYGSGRVNINTASDAALLSVDLPRTLVDKILAVRKEGIIFREPNQLLAELKGRVGLTEQELVRLATAFRHNMLGMDSSVFSLTLRATKNSNYFMKAACIFNLNSGIRYWVES